MPLPDPLAFTIQPDDLTGQPTRALIARHLAGMHSSSPPASVHALSVEKLRQPDVLFWSAWAGAEIAGCAALKRIDATRGEIKSMRVADQYLGKGVGRLLLNHILSEARRLQLFTLWLETGSTPDFLPALKLYKSAGFTRCGPFDGYVEDAFSVFMMRVLD